MPGVDEQSAAPAMRVAAGIARCIRRLLERTQMHVGKFRIPTLRNIAVTAPYMHDGSIATLREVLEAHYARGGRLIEDGPDAGDGSLSPRKASFVSGFTIDPSEIDELLAFLEALTDEAFLSDETLSNPW